MTTKIPPGGTAASKDILQPKLQLVAWEITRSCNLFCAHCRASALHGPYPDELSTEECLNLVDQILTVGRPILILTGGEPLLRPDVFQIADYAAGRGLRVVMGSNGTPITKAIAARMKQVPLSRISVSLDFPVAELQDSFRGETGAFKAALNGIARARQAGLEIQINSTITRLNAAYLDDLLTLAREVGAVAFHPFMLVPTGRGKGLAEVELSPQEYEKVLNWIYDKQVELGDRMFFKPTDAPHYLRVLKQRDKKAARSGQPPASKARAAHALSSISRGCLAGVGFCFISHRGRVQGCGYLDVAAGNIREQGFQQIWAESPLFSDLRDLSLIKGKCRLCEYKRLCGGCRARAYETSGDYLEEEPYCVYQPTALKKEARRTSA